MSIISAVFKDNFKLSFTLLSMHMKGLPMVSGAIGCAESRLNLLTLLSKSAVVSLLIEAVMKNPHQMNQL